ncbi:MAG: hypothetical protein IPO47_04855 [Bacteroidetes bacterium]|nr:hypothetical protein [Bacteroidota bacterium]
MTENKGESDYWVVKIDSIGDILWQKSLGGTFTDNATQMILAHDNSEIIIGITNSSDGDISGFNGGSDYWVVKLECTDPTTWYVDFDGDLYGSDSDSVISCITPLGYVTNNLDCNDTNF